MEPGQPAVVSTTARSASAAPPQPPEPRKFQAISATERLSKHPSDAAPHAKPPKEKGKGIFARMWSFRAAGPVYLGAQNPARGIEATRRVVREGVLDPRYRAAATRVTALICATPIMLYLTWELYQRRFQGKEQKKRPMIQTTEDGI